MATDIRFVNRFYNPFHVDADVPWPDPTDLDYPEEEYYIELVREDRQRKENDDPPASPYDEVGLTKNGSSKRIKTKKEEKHKSKRVAERSRMRDRKSVHVVFQM
jgi:hypothetical protein